MHLSRPVAEEVLPEQIPVVQMDYVFLKTETDVQHTAVPFEIKVLHLYSKQLGAGRSSPVQRKGADEFAAEFAVDFLSQLGHSKVVIQCDSEHSILALRDKIKQHPKTARSGIEIVHRESPVGSHASQGGVERMVGKFNDTARALRLQLMSRGVTLNSANEITS